MTTMTNRTHVGLEHGLAVLEALVELGLLVVVLRQPLRVPTSVCVTSECGVVWWLRRSDDGER